MSVSSFVTSLALIGLNVLSEVCFISLSVFSLSSSSPYSILFYVPMLLYFFHFYFLPISSFRCRNIPAVSYADKQSSDQWVLYTTALSVRYGGNSFHYFVFMVKSWGYSYNLRIEKSADKTLMFVVLS
jgi:hypothetical protein